MGKSKVTPTSSSCAFAQSSTLCKALTTTAVSNFNSWIIDLGASDHMTKESNFFLSHRPCSGKQKVQVADKTLTRVSGKGNVSFTEEYPHLCSTCPKNVLQPFVNQQT